MAYAPGITEEEFLRVKTKLHARDLEGGKSRSQLVEDNMWLVYGLSLDFCKQFPSLHRDEILSETQYRFLLAAAGWNPEGHSFSKYVRSVTESRVRRWAFEQTRKWGRNRYPVNEELIGEDESARREFRNDEIGSVIEAVNLLPAKDREFFVRVYGLEGRDPESPGKVSVSLGYSRGNPIHIKRRSFARMRKFLEKKCVA